MEKICKAAYMTGRIDAELAVESMLNDRAASIAVRVIDLMHQRPVLQRISIATGFCDGLVREIVVREQELIRLRATLRQVGGGRENEH